MRKKILSLTIVLCSQLFFSQVGIGTPTPRGALDINKPTTNNMGLVLPANADVSNIINPMGGNVAPGTIIYDSAKDCVRVYKATNVWSDCFCQCPAGSGFTLDCLRATNNGTLTSGTAASGVSSVISYTGGNGSAYAAQSILSTGITGLTATLNAGNFANGDGSLTYTITGTPSAAGTASFAINIGGQSCTLTRSVNTACVVDVAGASFSSTNGNAITSTQPAADNGYVLDIYTLDDSFNMTINGTPISTKEIFTYNTGQGRTVRFVDGSMYSGPADSWFMPVYTINGTATNPAMRIVISATGNITMFGSKTSGGQLFPLQLINGNTFNTVVWNTSATNTVKITQSTVAPPTYISGSGSGKRNAACP